MRLRANSLMRTRYDNLVSQAAQAERMKTQSDKYQGEVVAGDYVIFPIPDVDKSKASAPNLICRIV